MQMSAILTRLRILNCTHQHAARYCELVLLSCNAAMVISHYIASPLRWWMAQVLRYTLYGKERRTFVDASSIRSDWWQQVRDHWDSAMEIAYEKGEEKEEEEAFEREQTD